MDSPAAVLTLPSLGQDVQLVIQNGDFTYSYSLEEARKHVSLDVEGALSLDLGIIKATGSAKYLDEKKSSTFEARANVSSTIVRRTRRIPQEILASMEYERHLADPRFTHFVAEVVEGGSATLSFVQSCSSSEEAKSVMGKLKSKIVKIPVGGSTQVSFANLLQRRYGRERLHIEDAVRVARQMPTKLGRQQNTLSFKLLPLTILDSTQHRAIRTLDANLVSKTAAALEGGSAAQLKLKDLVEQDVFQNSFPIIKQQVAKIQAVFAEAETGFTQAARRLLPELRDGTTDYSPKVSELREAVALFEQRTRIAEEFIAKKYSEASILRVTVASLLNEGFENHLGGLTARSLADAEAPRLLLSFGGASINRSRHSLQQRMESLDIEDVGGSDSDGSSDDDDDDDDDDEWFENQQIVANVRESCAALRQQRLLALGDVIFGVAAINKAYRPGKDKRTKTNVGDVVLDYKGKLVIVTGLLPKAPTRPTLTVKDQRITVSWSHERSDTEESVVSTSGYIIRFRPQPNTSKDGPFPRATGNEPVSEVQCRATETNVTIERGPNGVLLFDDCDYEVMLGVQTTVGRSVWSKESVCRTLKLPSAASRMIDFYLDKCLTVKAERFCTDSRFEGELAVQIVDVAPEFEQSIPAARTQDRDNTIVVVFAGSSGHGKSTEINAFISYLLGGEPTDFARIMVIDDSGANQWQSVTQYVTCYRIRPLSPLFQGKTLLIVDTPGYGDARGIERDAFVTAAMSEFFKTIEHVNAIIFTCRANEVRTTFLSPISTYVFSLFAKDVRSCPRTIYTFSDAGTPLARGALQKLQWPVENGEVEVNNAAFTVDLDSKNQQKVRDWWLMSVRGKFQVMQMLLRRPPVPTAASASVTEDRLELERKCALVEKKIFRTANDAQNLIADLGALARAVGVAPGEKVLVDQVHVVETSLPPDCATTLCLHCHQTCHEICALSDDKDKKHCAAMSNGSCTVCKGRCDWTKHRNAKFILKPENRKEWVVPEDLIKRWNANNNTLEGVLLDAMDAYLDLQEELRKDILYLAQLTEKLMSKALLHDPAALITYIETLIHTARANGAPPEQINQMATAKATLLLAREVKDRGASATRDSQTLLQVLRAVRQEMKRRMGLDPSERAREEEKPCSLYNDLREKLPPEIRRRALEPLKTEGLLKGLFSSSARYPENLQAIVTLVQVVLKDGGVVAALETYN
ncbi:hypothetical protein EDB81DRAFT_943841 [Dactylonectria macrodidyma]|uniref:G domain-containing protein n=1 Tax=Dactylonectria macrodidyma TaxID=307937 RepID=A0A9P9FDZ6_9HYPO|nr:hypothetical protein EDB81DRAFT_943841 [Dactylonectria macrodidyma]